jgi:hypothetical protein
VPAENDEICSEEYGDDDPERDVEVEKPPPIEAEDRLALFQTRKRKAVA